MQEKGEEHVVVDLGDNIELTGNSDMVVEDVRLRRNMNPGHDITWHEFKERAFSCGLGGELWVYLNCITFNFIILTHDFLIQYWMWERFKINKKTVMGLCALVIMANLFAASCVLRRYRGMPFRIVGRFGRGVVDFIIFGSALIIRRYFPDRDMYHASQMSSVAGPLQVLLLVTLHIHSWGKILHQLSDFDKRDMLLGSVMQVLIYISSKNVHIFLVILFCFVIFYRICSYKVPTTPDLLKKDGMGLLPC